MAARAAVMRLIAAKDELEAQIAALISSLPACVRVPARNDLLDDEGFPRADIDVYQVRVIRSNIARLQTDHTSKMKEIETAMFALHQDAAAAAALAPPSLPVPASSATTSASASSASTPPTAAAAASSAAPVSVANLRVAEDQALAPFLMVASIVEGSPSHRAGLRTGDHILRFGSLTRANWSTDALQQVWHNDAQIILEGTHRAHFKEICLKLSVYLCMCAYTILIDIVMCCLVIKSHQMSQTLRIAPPAGDARQRGPRDARARAAQPRGLLRTDAGARAVGGARSARVRAAAVRRRRRGRARSRGRSNGGARRVKPNPSKPRPRATIGRRRPVAT